MIMAATQILNDSVKHLNRSMFHKFNLLKELKLKIYKGKLIFNCFQTYEKL